MQASPSSRVVRLDELDKLSTSRAAYLDVSTPGNWRCSLSVSVDLTQDMRIKLPSQGINTYLEILYLDSRTKSTSTLDGYGVTSSLPNKMR